MSAKFLHGISDDPQLEKQMDKQVGCVAGFLQLFDRHHILTGKRLYGPKRLGAAQQCSNNHKLDAVVASAQNTTSEENQRPSFESSGYSNAASRASSMDCNGSTCQPILSKEQGLSENVSTAQAALQSRASENSQLLSVDNKDVRAAHVCNNSRAPILSRDQPRFSLDTSRPSLDIRDVVRDSFYRDSPKPSMDTRVQNRIETHKYSPKQRSLMDGKDTTTTGKDPFTLPPKSLPKHKEQVQASLELAVKSVVDANLKKASANFVDSREAMKSSLESKEALQFSYDSREIPRASFFEYKDALRSSFKLREAPRLSLDSRAHLGGSLYGRESRNDKQGKHANDSNPHLEETSDEKKRSPSVVARLMGLEAMPHTNSTSQKRAELRRSVSESRINYDILRSQYTEGKSTSQFKSSTEGNNNQDSKAVENAASRQIASSPKQKEKDSSAFSLSKTSKLHQIRSHLEEGQRKVAETSEQMHQFPEGSTRGSLHPYHKPKTADPKPVNIHRYPIEAAPWKREIWQSYQQNAFGPWNFSPERKRNSPQDSYALYSEIENRLKQRGLEGSGKDFETLKQIVEAVQLKSLLYSQKYSGTNHNQQSSFLQESGLNDFDSTPKTRISSGAKLLSRQQETLDKLARPFEASIVVMKPAKILSNLKSPRTSHTLSTQREKVSNGSSQNGYKGKGDIASSQNYNSKIREPLDNCGNANISTGRTRKECVTSEALQTEPNSRTTRTSVSPPATARIPQSSRALSSMKSPNSSTPNKQRTTKAENERKAKQSVSPVKERDNTRGSPAMQSPKSARQNTGKKIGLDKENSFSRNKMKIKETSVVELDESELNSSSDNPLADEVSMLSDSNISTVSHMDMGKPASAKCRDDEKSDAETTYVGEKNLDHCNKSSASTEIPEQPSPVSVLDSSFYKEDCSPSPIMKRSITFTDEEETRRHDDSDIGTSNCLIFLTNQQYQLDGLKLDEPLAVTHKVMNYSDNVKLPEMDSIRLTPELDSLQCGSGVKKSNPVYSYIAEILLVSGLLEDTEVYPAVYHSSVSPLDPQLFFFLEERLSNSELQNGHGQDYSHKKKKTHIDSINRELIFNTVNDILCRKLSPYLHHIRPWMCSSKKVQRRRPTGEGLLKDIWNEFQGLLTVPSEDICETLCRMLQKDLSGHIDSWGDHTTEISGLVLDIERMIFKELIDETIRDMGAVSSKCLVSIPRRKLRFH